MNEEQEHPHADLIEKIAVALWKGHQTIDELSSYLNSDKNLIESLLQQIVEVEGAFIEERNGISHYYLTESGEKDARFIAIGMGEYEIILENLSEEDAVETHLQILKILEHTEEKHPIFIRSIFYEEYPESNISRKLLNARVRELEDNKYTKYIYEDNEHYGCNYITERGKKLLKQMEKWNLKPEEP